MDKQGVLYLLMAHSHGHKKPDPETQQRRILPSIWSLRKHWDGPIAVMTDDKEAIPKILKNEVEIVLTSPCSWNAVKASLHRRSPFEKTLFFDNDTIIVGDITPLFPRTEEIVLTLWTWSHTRTAARRYSPLVDRGLIHRSHWHRLRDSKIPVINSGIFAVDRSFSLEDRWARTTEWLVNEDEMALQLLLLDYPVKFRVEEERYNRMTPRWKNPPIPSDTVVWHLLGDYVRPINELHCQLRLEMADAGWLSMTDLEKQFASPSPV